MKNLLAQAVKITLPVFFGYMAIGIAFGIVTVNAGYSWWVALLMGLLMYTGAGQYFAIGLFSGGASLIEILIVEFLLSIRHTFYGFALISKYKNLGKLKPYLIFSITDETFAIVQSIPDVKNVNKGILFTLISALDQFYWCLGSVIGALAYGVLVHYNLSQYLSGVDFSLTALFIVLLIEQIKNTKDYFTVGISLLVTSIIIAFYKNGFIHSSNIIWCSICVSLGILLALKGSSFYKNQKTAENREELN